MSIPKPPKFEFDVSMKPYSYYNEAYGLWAIFSINDLERCSYNTDTLEAVLPIIAAKPPVIHQRYSEVKALSFNLGTDDMPIAEKYIEKMGIEKSDVIVGLGFVSATDDILPYICMMKKQLSERVSMTGLFNKNGEFMTILDVDEILEDIKKNVDYTPYKIDSNKFTS